MSLKIYTKTGDSGETSLFGGKRLPKDHVRISAYGEVDELNSHIGLVRDLISNEIQISLLTSIQNKLFVVGSYLAKDPDKEMALPELEDDGIEQLEIQIDSISETIPPLKNFILPGGHPVVAHCHIARCVCRRAERSVVALGHLEKIDAYILRYLNRLSDYLFVLCRLISHEMGAEEIKWMPSSSK